MPLAKDYVCYSVRRGQRQGIPAKTLIDIGVGCKVTAIQAERIARFVAKMLRVKLGKVTSRTRSVVMATARHPVSPCLILSCMTPSHIWSNTSLTKSLTCTRTHTVTSLASSAWSAVQQSSLGWASDTSVRIRENCSHSRMVVFYTKTLPENGDRRFKYPSHHSVVRHRHDGKHESVRSGACLGAACESAARRRHVAPWDVLPLPAAYPAIPA